MPNRILVITDDATDANALKRILGAAKGGLFEIKWARRLSAGLKRLRAGGIDAVVADLSLPDSRGMSTFDQLFIAAPHVPILTLSAGNKDKALAIEAMQRGAQGSLTKGYFVSHHVPQVLRNIIQRKTVEESLFKEKARAEIALNSIGDAVICTDTFGNIDYLNAAAENMTGWSRAAANGLPIGKVFQLINGITRDSEKNPVELVLKYDKPKGLNADTVLIRRDGSEIAIEDSVSPIHDWDGKLTGAVVVFHDVSQAAAITKKMAHLAHHDFLTGLPNRLLLNDRIMQAITLAKRSSTQLAVLFLDLDNFKHINDSLGHETGDKLLQSVTQRLRTCVRSSDTVSRQGGDEFVILLTDGKYGEDAALTADKILTELALPHRLDKNELHITTSIGISIYPEDGQDAETLIKNADTAMYHAKEKGRNNYQFFSSEMNTRAVARQIIEAHLRFALEKEEFLLHYQPKVNLDTGMITGAEALLRWKHAEWGMISPEKFVPIAEDCGLIVPIGRWVMREACMQAKQWMDAGLMPGSVAVNISALEFRKTNFAAGVRDILSDTGLDADALQLEITESVLMRDAESSTAILKDLKSLGVQLAVDDFGTGYTSLGYLQRFPIDVLKIDRSFVHDIGSTAHDGVIVGAVIGMGNHLHLQVVAEGVENQEQLAFLRGNHCAEGQGYVFSRPVAASQFAKLLAAGAPKRRTQSASKSPAGNPSFNA
jgi:diguanylate cyclase (GGDEF)-like protein/PAS domain S-box-containing protein